MRNRLYLKVAAAIMAITALLVFSLTAHAQRQVQVVELQRQPDGTEVYVPKTIDVPETSAEEVAAAKRKAATVTAEEDDLQYFLNNLAKTRAGESTVVIDLSTFKDTIRQTTLVVNQGISLKFTNGAIRRGKGLPKGQTLITISNGTEVEFDETVIVSGENLANGGAVALYDASLKTAAWIGNTRFGTNEYSGAIYTLYSSKLEIIGGTIDIGGVRHSATEPLIVSGGNIDRTIIRSEADAIISGENTYIASISFEKKTSKLYLKSAVKYLKFYDYYNVISDGYAVATGYDGYQLTESDLQKIIVTNYDNSVNNLKDYEKRLEGNSIVMRKKVKDLQSAINNAADGKETTFNVSDYDELTTGILIPTGKKIKMTGTKNVTLASNFTGDYIFRTEGDAQLDITIPGFSGYSSTALPKYGLVAGGSASKIIVNQSGTNTLALPNTLLATENGGTIDCYANISTKGIYNAAGGTMNIYSESGEVETFTDDGGTVNITGPVKFYSTFTSLGTATLLSENVTSLAKLVLGKQSSMTFTSKWVKPNSLNISFKDNDYVLDQTYITFESSTTMLSGFETVSFTLQSEHSAYLDNNAHQLSIEETDHAAQAGMIAKIRAQIQVSYEKAAEIQDRVKALEESIYSYHKSGIITDGEKEMFLDELEKIQASLNEGLDIIGTVESLLVVFNGQKSYYFYQSEINRSKEWIDTANHATKETESALKSLAASHKKPFTNTDDLQDYLNSLAQNNETTPEDPAKVPVADGTEIKDIVIPEGTHVEIDIDGNGGESTDDLQAYLNGLVNVSEGSSLTMRGKWVVPTGALNPRIDVRGIIDIYATIILEGTREEVVRVYGGGTANWRGNMPTGKIHNEGTLNHYSGTIGHIENHGTTNHSGGTCHHIVNYKTYTFSGGTIDGNGSTFDYAFENHGTAHLTGGTIIHRHTLIYIVKGATTYIDGTKLDDSTAMTTIRAYEDFHMRGDYDPVNIELYYGVRIHFLTSWTVRWHITFIDNRVTVRKVIFMSDDFTFDDRNIQYIDYPLPDGYRWYWNREENGIELRDDRVYDSDDLQNFLDGLASNPGTSLEPRRLYGDGHTVYINRRFSFPALTHVLIRDIRLIFDGADGRWDIPSGTTVYLCDTKVENDGEGVSGLHVHGDLYLEKTIFLNVHLYLYRTLYIWDRITSPLYIHYISDGGLNGGERIAEGADGYILTESDLQNLIYSDEPTDGHDWYLMLDGNAIVLADRNITGIGGIHGVDTATPRAAFTPDGTLRISGTSSDTPCSLFRTDGTRIATGTAAEIATKAMGIAKGHYILRIGSETLKLVR